MSTQRSEVDGAHGAGGAAARQSNGPEKMPKTEMRESSWTPAERAEYLRRRRGRNYLLLGALAGFCLLIYAIALVKLHEYGQLW